MSKFVFVRFSRCTLISESYFEYYYHFRFFKDGKIKKNQYCTFSLRRFSTPDKINSISI